MKLQSTVAGVLSISLISLAYATSSFPSMPTLAITFAMLSQLSILSMHSWLANSMSLSPDLPIFPPNFDELIATKKFKNALPPSPDKKIPRNYWCSFREVPPWPNMTDHVRDMAEKVMDKNWSILFLDNPAQELLLETFFPNTSVLWAYRIIHPAAKNSASDIWRLATLYTFGGFYMDDDSYLKTSLEDIVRPDDELIVAQEGNPYRDDCYLPTYHLSNHHMKETYNSTEFMSFFGARNLVNWAIFITPRHPLMRQALMNSIELVRKEYFRDSGVKFHRYDSKWKYCMCVTGPQVFTASTRKYLLLHPNMTIRVMRKDFAEYGGMFKVNINSHYRDQSSVNYMAYMNKHNIPLLSEYAPLTAKELEGKAISLPNAKAIYKVENRTKRLIPDYDTFLAMKFRLHDVVKLEDDLFESIPLGEVLPHMEN